MFRNNRNEIISCIFESQDIDGKQTFSILFKNQTTGDKVELHARGDEYLNQLKAYLTNNIFEVESITDKSFTVKNFNEKEWTTDNGKSVIPEKDYLIRILDDALVYITAADLIVQ